MGFRDLSPFMFMDSVSFFTGGVEIVGVENSCFFSVFVELRAREQKSTNDHYCT